MDHDREIAQGHESVNHEDPAASGLLPADDAVVPGTGILGDETLVRDGEDKEPPGIYPAAMPATGGTDHPGPGTAPATVAPAREVGPPGHEC